MVRGCEVCAECNGNGSFEKGPSATLDVSDWLTRMVSDKEAFAARDLVQVSETDPNPTLLGIVSFVLLQINRQILGSKLIHNLRERGKVSL